MLSKAPRMSKNTLSVYCSTAIALSSSYIKWCNALSVDFPERRVVVDELGVRLEDSLYAYFTGTTNYNNTITIAITCFSTTVKIKCNCVISVIIIYFVLFRQIFQSLGIYVRALMRNCLVISLETMIVY